MPAAGAGQLGAVGRQRLCVETHHALGEPQPAAPGQLQGLSRTGPHSMAGSGGCILPGTLAPAPCCTPFHPAENCSLLALPPWSNPWLLAAIAVSGERASSFLLCRCRVCNASPLPLSPCASKHTLPDRALRGSCSCPPGTCDLGSAALPPISTPASLPLHLCTAVLLHLLILYVPPLAAMFSVVALR